MNRQINILFRHELIVDSFAGGGGASTGIEAAFGRPVDIAVNHDGEAIAMHAANHPGTQHLCGDVFDVDPLEVTKGQPVGLAWFSPDCKHFSKAKGGRPREKKIRGLAWVVIRWAATVKPRVIMLENVEEFQDWGPLMPDGKPDPLRAGMTFRRWKKQLENHGYTVDSRELRACDYGAPTVRRRLFVIARRDKRPIVWPKPTHGKGLKPYRSAAECIDWSIPCPSIFTRERPLAPATLRRIARGVMKYVVNAKKPFIVPVTHPRDARIHDVDAPFCTVTGAHRGELALVVPTLINTRNGERDGQAPRVRDIQAPAPTVTAKGSQGALVTAFLEQANTGMTGHDAREPVSTIVGKGCTQRLVTAFLSHNYTSNTCGGEGRLELPAKTVVTGGHHSLVQAFLLKYYGTDQNPKLEDPLATITTKDRFGLVTVTIDGESYVIVDIGMRMLTPRELYRAQGFPESTIIDTPFNGKPMTKTAQVRLCGNSVCPPLAEALVTANFKHEAMYEAVNA